MTPPDAATAELLEDFARVIRSEVEQDRENGFYAAADLREMRAVELEAAAALIRTLLSVIAEKDAALEKAAGWFEEYALQHYAKALTAPDGREQHGREVKGKTNADRAKVLRAALTPPPAKASKI